MNRLGVFRQQNRTLFRFYHCDIRYHIEESRLPNGSGRPVCHRAAISAVALIAVDSRLFSCRDQLVAVGEDDLLSFRFHAGRVAVEIELTFKVVC